VGVSRWGLRLGRDTTVDLSVGLTIDQDLLPPPLFIRCTYPKIVTRRGTVISLRVQE